MSTIRFFIILTLAACALDGKPPSNAATVSPPPAPAERWRAAEAAPRRFLLY